MKRLLRAVAIIVVGLLLLLLIGPFFVPIRPLTDTLPPQALADPDSRFVEINGLAVHYKSMGQGEPAFILLHGFAASLFSWRAVIAPLAEYGRVAAFDRPAFGLTERPLPGEWTGENPYTAEAQVAFTIGLMDALGIREAILVGNSAGGTVAVHVALHHPERVRALILVSPAIYTGGGTPGFLRPLLSLPQVNRLGPLLVRSIRLFGTSFGQMAWHDPSKLTPEIWEGYTKPLRAHNWDRALWEFVRASHPTDLASRLSGLTMPVLVITGDDDRIVPTAQSIRLASELPNAQLVVIPGSGHVAHEETPEEFMAAVRSFLPSVEAGRVQ